MPPTIEFHDDAAVLWDSLHAPVLLFGDGVHCTRCGAETQDDRRHLLLTVTPTDIPDDPDALRIAHALELLIHKRRRELMDRFHKGISAAEFFAY